MGQEKLPLWVVGGGEEELITLFQALSCSQRRGSGAWERKGPESRQRQAEPEGSDRGCDTTIFPSSAQV